MIQIPAQASVFVMHESVNFRKGIDGMAAVARVVLNEEPMVCGAPGYVTQAARCRDLAVGGRSRLQFR